MTDIQFYFLAMPLDRMLPKLLEKAFAGGMKTRVKFASEEKAELMNTLLWTYDPDSFLPHGTKKDGNGALQPIYLTASNDNPNAASLVIVTDGSEISADAPPQRAFDIVEAHDEAAMNAAQSRLGQYRQQGHAVSCVRQTPSGAWEKLPQ